MAERKEVYAVCETNCRYPTLTKEQIYEAIVAYCEAGSFPDVDTGFITTIKTINGVGLKFFVGKQADYEALSDAEKEGVFAVFTDESAKETLISMLETLKSSLEGLQNNLRDGSFVVAEATHAASADKATEATHAASADKATEATHAASADKASKATSAITATKADKVISKALGFTGTTSDEVMDRGLYFIDAIVSSSPWSNATENIQAQLFIHTFTTSKKVEISENAYISYDGTTNKISLTGCTGFLEIRYIPISNA